jgi:hypothetical protein
MQNRLLDFIIEQSRFRPSSGVARFALLCRKGIDANGQQQNKSCE